MVHKNVGEERVSSLVLVEKNFEVHDYKGFNLKRIRTVNMDLEEKDFSDCLG